MSFVMKEAELGWGQSQLFALSSLDGGVVGPRDTVTKCSLCVDVVSLDGGVGYPERCHRGKPSMFKVHGPELFLVMNETVTVKFLPRFLPADVPFDCCF